MIFIGNVYLVSFAAVIRGGLVRDDPNNGWQREMAENWLLCIL